MQALLSLPIMILAGVSGVLFLMMFVFSFFGKRPSIPFPAPLPPPAPFAGGGCPPGTPPSPACIQSQNDAQNKRNAVLSLCNTIRATRGARDASAAAAAALYVLFAALLTLAIAAAASIFGIGLAIALFFLAALSLGAAIGFTIRAAMENDLLTNAEAALVNAINDFNAAAAKVGLECCPDTIKVNRDTPTCASM